MNKKILFSAIVVAALMVASMQMAVFAVGNGVTPLGLEIAGKADEVVSGLQTDIEDFITEQQVNMAETQEDRLAVIEEKKAELMAEIEAANETRQDLIAQLEAGDITEEEFAAEMKVLATGIANKAKSMGELGSLLGGIGQGLAEQLKTRAQGLSDEIVEAENEIAEQGLTIAQEMSGRNLPVPDNIPGKPDQIPPVTLPEQVSGDVTPTELPEQVPDQVPPTDLPEQTPDEVPPTDLPEETPDEIPPTELPDQVPGFIPTEPPVEIPGIPSVPTP